MSDRIRLLPDSVSNQIAAGEVVNRPASVVKEMMENAVDAGARSVTVNFRDGGKEMIQVVDDGCGMSPLDARLAFDRHATSKITRVDDIYSLSTFGFRGEALASIAAVAEVQLRTRPHEDELGTAVEIAGGAFRSQEVVSCPPGTQFLVRNLFYNVPARRRFLDKSSTEARHITAEFQRVALCHPETAFLLYNNDAPVYNLPPSSLRQRIVGVIGKHIANNLLEVGADTTIVQVSGFVGRPSASKQTNRDQFLFVNGRYFKSAYFHKAILQAYEKLIPAGTQPSYFLYLKIDPERIDVNVHPQKIEIKFDDNNAVWQIINAAVRESLGKLGMVPMMDFDADMSVEIPVCRKDAPVRSPEVAPNPDFNPFNEDYGSVSGGGRVPRGADCSGSAGGYAVSERGMPGRSGEEPEPSGVAYPVAAGEAEEFPDPQLMEFISGDETQQGLLEIESGCAFGPAIRLGQGYAVATVGDGVAVVDIRRAYEAVLYDRYMLMLGSGSSATQQLLFPERILLSIDDYNLMKLYRDDFVSFGFDLEFGQDELWVEVTGVPADFTSSAVGDLLFELLDGLREETRSPGELRRGRLASIMSRNGASALSRNLGEEELEELLSSLAACGNSCYTPSGRPVMTVIPESEIRKRLK